MTKIVTYSLSLMLALFASTLSAPPSQAGPLEDQHKALELKSKEADKYTERLSKKLEEKTAALEKIKDRRESAEEELSNFPKHNVNPHQVYLKDQDRKDSSLEKTLSKEVAELEDYLQRASERADEARAKLQKVTEDLAEQSRKNETHVATGTQTDAGGPTTPLPSSVSSPPTQVTPSSGVKPQVAAPPVAPPPMSTPPGKAALNSTILKNQTHLYRNFDAALAARKQRKDKLGSLENGLSNDNSDIRIPAIIEMSKFHNSNPAVVAQVYEIAFRSPHQDARQAAEALLADYLPETDRIKIKKELHKSIPDIMKGVSTESFPGMIAWLDKVSKMDRYIKTATNPPLSCTHCTGVASTSTSPSSPIHSIDPFADPTLTTNAKDPEKLLTKRANQLREIFTTEKAFAEALHFFIEDKDEKHKRTIIEAFIDKKLIKSADYSLITYSLTNLTGILANSKELIAKMEPAFSGTNNDKGSILKMEESLLNNLDPKALQKTYQEYVINSTEFRKVLTRIEASEPGKKILEERWPELKNKLDDSQHSKGRAAQPTDFSLMPVQRLMRYSSLLKSITDKKDHKLDFEPFDKIALLGSELENMLLRTNGLIPPEDKSKNSTWKETLENSKNALKDSVKPLFKKK